MVQLTKLLNSNGFTTDAREKSTVHKETIDQVTTPYEPIFLAATKKWGSIL